MAKDIRVTQRPDSGLLVRTYAPSTILVNYTTTPVKRFRMPKMVSLLNHEK